MTARLRALKASLRLLSTMQQNAGAADRLRLLIEGPLPQALAKLFEHWAWFSEHGYAVGMDRSKLVLIFFSSFALSA